MGGPVDSAVAVATIDRVGTDGVLLYYSLSTVSFHFWSLVFVWTLPLVYTGELRSILRRSRHLFYPAKRVAGQFTLPVHC